jgi:hypothetical protein
MGHTQSIHKINFEDIQTVYKNPEMYLLINTLNDEEQECLLLNTIRANQEESIINKYIRYDKNIQIIIYGRNSCDDKIYKKYQQLTTLGFTKLYVYMGGMFEWLMLQDIYGFDEFPTTIKQLDFLKYKPTQRLNLRMITHCTY